MLKIWWIWKIEIWCEELVNGQQTVPYQPGALSGVVTDHPVCSLYCLVVFQTYFNPNF